MYKFGLSILCVFLFCIVYIFVQTTCNKVNSPYIYNHISKDNWGGEDVPEFDVVMTKTQITITELRPNSIFFTRFVKDSSATTITFDLETADYQSNEYWARIANAKNRLCFHGSSVEYVFIHAHSGIVRIIFDPTVGEDDTYYLFPYNSKK